MQFDEWPTAERIARYWPKITMGVCACVGATILLLFTLDTAAAESKRVMMLHSFGRDSKPWSDYAKNIRGELDRQSPWPLDVTEHPLLTARSGEASPDAAFAEYLRALYAERPLDLIVSFGAPAVAFVQRHRQQLFATTPMIFTAVEQRRVQYSTLRERLSNKTAEVEAARQQLTAERGRAEQLGVRAGELERQLIARPRRADALGRRVQEFGTQLEEQARFLTDYENASDRLRNEAMSARERLALRAELTEAEGRHRLAIDTVTTEKSLIESELKRSQDERARLQREIAAMRRDAESGGANVRKENAVLRESINDVAAEVARLTATLEGPNSPIAAILDGDAGRPADERGERSIHGQGAAHRQIQGHARGPHPHIARRGAARCRRFRTGPRPRAQRPATPLGRDRLQTGGRSVSQSRQTVVQTRLA